MARAAKPGELIGIQYLRGLAALLVVVHHIIECQYNFAGARMIPREIVLVGSVGVDLFFVISGIIMMVSSFPRDRRPLRPLEFLKRRGQRIYPLYWCFAALILLIGAVGVSSGEHRTVDDLIRSLLLLPSKVGLLSYAWTLQDEVYFYAAFAVALAFGDRLVAVVGVSGLIALAYVTSMYFPDEPSRMQLSNPIVFEFCFGLMLGYSYEARPHWFTPRHGGVGALFGVAAIMAAPWFTPNVGTFGPDQGLRLFVWGIPAALIVAWALGFSRWPGRVGASMLLLGNASYALYLSHYFIVTAYGRALSAEPLLRALPYVPVASVLTVSCVAFGVGCHLCLEKPVTHFFKTGRFTVPRAGVMPTGLATRSA